MSDFKPYSIINNWATGVKKRANNPLEAILNAIPKTDEEYLNVAIGGGLSGKVNALQRAQAQNTYKYLDPVSDLGKSYGKQIGFPQAKGTPLDKLFSNSATNIENLGEARRDIFRTDMLKRASELPYGAEGGFKDKLGKYTVDLIEHKGNVTIKVLDGDNLVAAAKSNKGFLDSIAVAPAYKGNKIGENLLEYLHNKNIANIYEVADRSKGFVNIQKKVIEKVNK